MLVLNVGCGSNKIPGCVNIDTEPSCQPDLLANVITGLPYKDGEVDKIYFFHCIEHIPASLHPLVLHEFRRILKPEGRLIVSYPEFQVIAFNWLYNKQGKRDFWKATIYGLQRYPSDYHVALMDSEEFRPILEMVGFKDITFNSEVGEPFNTVCKCVKGEPLPIYEELLRREIFQRDQGNAKSSDSSAA